MGQAASWVIRLQDMPWPQSATSAPKRDKTERGMGKNLKKRSRVKC